MNKIANMILTTAAILVVMLAAAIALGGPGPIAALDSINAPFSKADFSDVPAARHFMARDGTRLAWLHYAPAGDTVTADSRRRIVLVHGSSARARSMHPLARALARAGFTVDALDMRGHGDSGPRGRADHVGQLEDDVADFMQAVPHDGPSTLAGFSSGGGFVLRLAGGMHQDLFDRYLLLAPFLHHAAPTQRPDNGGWVSVGLPRLIALGMLNRIGIRAWNHLPVLRFGLNDVARESLTGSYDYTLATAFRPRDDYRGDIRRARKPIRVVAGAQDELFDSSRYAAEFADAAHPVTVTLVEGVNHIGLTLDERAYPAIVAACRD